MYRKAIHCLPQPLRCASSHGSCGCGFGGTRNRAYCSKCFHIIYLITQIFRERANVNQTIKIAPLLLCVAFGLVACTSGGQDAQQSSETKAKDSTAASKDQGEESTQASTTTAQSSEDTGTISGRATDNSTGEPVSNIYIVVGWRNMQLAAITDEDGRYTVPNVPAGEPAPVFGFHEGQYLYRNSNFHDDLDINLEPGEEFTYDFTVREHDDPAGQPEVSDPSISSKTVAAGEKVTFGLTAKGGEGGLSPEVIASSPKLGQMVLLKSEGGDRFREEFTVPPDTPPGEYTFTFFAASKKCYDPKTFPELTLRVT